MERKIVVLESTGFTPFFAMDYYREVVELKGRSSPKSALDFYQPILSMIHDFLNHGARSLVVNIAMEYFNTASGKCIFDILRNLQIAKQNGLRIIVNWFYDMDDDDMLDVGMDYSESLGISFNFIPTQSQEISSFSASKES